MSYRFPKLNESRSIAPKQLREVVDTQRAEAPMRIGDDTVSKVRAVVSGMVIEPIAQRIEGASPIKHATWLPIGTEVRRCNWRGIPDARGKAVGPNKQLGGK